MLFSIISRERNDLLLNEQKLAQSGLSDKDKVAQLGKLFGAKYVLYGSFSSITNMVNSQKQTYYKLNLSILNIETGQEVFIDEAELELIEFDVVVFHNCSSAKFHLVATLRETAVAFCFSIRKHLLPTISADLDVRSSDFLKNRLTHAFCQSRRVIDNFLSNYLVLVVIN